MNNVIYFLEFVSEGFLMIIYPIIWLKLGTVIWVTLLSSLNSSKRKYKRICFFRFFFNFSPLDRVSRILDSFLKLKQKLDGSSRFVIPTYDRLKSVDFAFYMWAESLGMVVPRPGQQPRIFAFVHPFQSTVDDLLVQHWWLHDNAMYY